MMERNAQTRTLRTMAALVLALVGTLALAALTPTHAFAAESVAHTHDGKGNRVDYESIYDAIAAGYGADTVYLDKDIEISSVINVAEGKTLKLDMQGHAIKVTSYNVRIFDVSEDAKLTLTGSEERTFSYKGYDKSDTASDMQVTSGGLLTGGKTVGTAGAINMRAGSTLTLDHVAVAGNETANGSSTHSGGGGINVDESCELYLENNAIVTANYSNMNGGGILVGGENARVVLNGGSVTHNFAKLSGGGIYAVRKNASISLRQNSHIDDNRSFSCGGGVCFFSSSFELTCNDATSTISKNYAVEGGGVCAVSASTETNTGLIEGLEISDNSSFSCGGGLSISQENIAIKNCTISGNDVSYGDGGGLYACNDDILLDGCTVTDNTATTEGGGVYVLYLYDLKVAGKLTVKDNARADGAKDDVFLDSTSSNNIWAYLRGNLGEGSSVGIRTGVTGDRRVMKDLTNYIEGTLFMDMDEYHLSYSSSDNELWQRTGEYDYLVTLNGKSVRRFTRGDSVTIDGSSDTASEFFCRWDTDQSTGISSGISETDKYKELLSFTMPQNDVNLVGVYASPLTSADLRYFSKPVAGQTLPTFATFHWKNSTLSSVGTQQRDVSLTWYEVATDGTKTQASGVAKAGTTYVACFSIAPDPTMARVFSSSMKDDAVTVYVNGGGTEKSASTSVDASTGVLTVTTAESTTEGDAPAGQGGTITVKLMDAGLSIEAGEQAMLLADANDADEDLIGTLTVAYAEGSSSVTIAAPEKAGWNFCNWEKVAEGCSYDDVLGTVTVNDLDGISELTATYTPVVTAAEVGLDAPVTGATLPTSLSALSVSSTDGSTIDLVEEFSEDGTLPVLWSSGSSSVTAQASTTYTALIELAEAEGLTDVEKVMSPNAVVTANGTEASSAGFVVLNSKLYLSVTFPETQGARLSEVTQPDDIELSFDEAKTCQEQQDKAGEDDLCWPLPKSCAITLEGGQTIACDVTWDVPTGFDANATGAQKLTATGTLSLPSYIDANDVSLDVTCAINVAAPEGSDDKGDDEDDEHGKGDEKGDEDDTTKPDSKGDGKKSLPQTGDTNSTSNVVALGAAGVAVLVAALILRNRKK